MYKAKFRDSLGLLVYRTYKFWDDFQVRRIAETYAKRHNLTLISIVKGE